MSYILNYCHHSVDSSRSPMSEQCGCYVRICRGDIEWLELTSKICMVCFLFCFGMGFGFVCNVFSWLIIVLCERCATVPILS